VRPLLETAPPGSDPLSLHDALPISLRRGERYHLLLAESKVEALQAWTKGELIDTGWGYPGLMEGEDRVYGELYRVDEKTLARLRSEEHTSELQSRFELVCRLLLEKK